MVSFPSISTIQVLHFDRSGPDDVDFRGTFAESGFGGRESYLPEDLKFEKLSDRVGTWPILRADLAERLRETESLLPDFKYDTTPSEKQSLFIDSDFPEAYLTAFVTQGWKTDELKSSFVIVQWKSRPKPGEARSAGADDRSIDRWVLIEEEIPNEYRDNLIDGKVTSISSGLPLLYVLIAV
jgi:hypothetical protein